MVTLSVLFAASFCTMGEKEKEECQQAEDHGDIGRPVFFGFFFNVVQMLPQPAAKESSILAHPLRSLLPGADITPIRLQLRLSCQSWCPFPGSGYNRDGFACPLDAREVKMIRFIGF